MHGQTGGLILGGLAKTVVVLALVAVVVFDFGAVVVNSMQLDDIAGSALRIGRQSYAQTGRLTSAEEAVENRLEREEGVTLDRLEISDGELVLTVSRPSQTLLAHRIPPLEQHTERTATKQAALP